MIAHAANNCFSLTSIHLFFARFYNGYLIQAHFVCFSLAEYMDIGAISVFFSRRKIFYLNWTCYFKYIEWMSHTIWIDKTCSHYYQVVWNVVQGLHIEWSSSSSPPSTIFYETQRESIPYNEWNIVCMCVRIQRFVPTFSLTKKIHNKTFCWLE